MALHTAAREGNVEELKALIQSGSKIDEKDKHSRTPLHMASWAGHVRFTYTETLVLGSQYKAEDPGTCQDVDKYFGLIGGVCMCVDRSWRQHPLCSNG